MLDANAKRIFEAHSEIMAAESGASAVAWFDPIAKQTTSLQQYEELCSMLNKINLISAPPKLSSSSSGPQHRRKRRRTCELVSLPQTVSATRLNLGLREETPPLNKDFDLLGLSQNCALQSYGVNKPNQGLEAKEPSNLMKNYGQLPRKRVSRIKRSFSKVDSVACSVNSSAPRAVAPLAGKNRGNEWEQDEKFDGFSKEIDDAITRIESLIPTLQNLVSAVHHSNERTVGDSCLPSLSSSVPPIPVGRSKNVEITRSKLSHTEKYPAAYFPVNQNWNAKYIGDNVPSQTVFLKKDANHRRGEIKLPNEIMNQTIYDKPLNWVSTQYDAGGMGHSITTSLQRNLELQKNLQVQLSHLRNKTKPTMDRVKSLKRTFSRKESVASQIPEHMQGLGTKPHQFYNGSLNPNQMNCGEVIVKKDASLRHQTPVPSVGSSNFMRPNRTSNLDKSRYKWSQNHTRGRTAIGNGLPSKRIQFRDQSDRSLIRKNPNGALRSKILLHQRESEDTSWGSPTSSCWSTQLSDSHSSSSENYLSTSICSHESDESEAQHGKLVRLSMRRQHEASDSAYNTSSYYSSSQDPYSDTGPSSFQCSSERSYKWDDHVERGKRVGRLRRLKKKLGMIFHHHHHHHHHYHSGGDESDVGHPKSLWKRVGKMFHHTRKSDHEKPKAVIKRVPTKKQQGGHFRALVEGLMRHVRHTKKSNQAKDEFRRIGNRGHGGKEATKKLPCWPKRRGGGRGGLKMANKGRVKLGRSRTKTRRPQLAAAKMILRQ